MPSKSTSKKTSKKETVGSIGYLKNGLLKQGCVVVFKSDEKKPESFLDKMKKVYGLSLTAHASPTAEFDDKFNELKEKMSDMKATVEDQEYPEDNYFLATNTTTNALDEAVRELTGGKMSRLGDKKSKDKKDDESDNEEEESKEKKGKKDSKKDSKKAKKEESDAEESEKEESEDEKPKKGKKDSKKDTKKDSKKAKKEESDAEPSDDEKEGSGSEAESEDEKPKKNAKKSSSKGKGK